MEGDLQRKPELPLRHHGVANKAGCARKCSAFDQRRRHTAKRKIMNIWPGQPMHSIIFFHHPPSAVHDSGTTPRSERSAGELDVMQPTGRILTVHDRVVRETTTHPGREPPSCRWKDSSNNEFFRKDSSNNEDAHCREGWAAYDGR